MRGPGTAYSVLTPVGGSYGEIQPPATGSSCSDRRAQWHTEPKEPGDFYYDV